MMVFDKEPHQINFSLSYETELNGVWEQKGNSLLWTKRDTKLDKKNEARNKVIQKLREPFLSETKGRRHHYGISEPYNYKSEEHKQQYYEILKAADLLNKNKNNNKKICMMQMVSTIIQYQN